MAHCSRPASVDRKSFFQAWYLAAYLAGMTSLIPPSSEEGLATYVSVSDPWYSATRDGVDVSRTVRPFSAVKPIAFNESRTKRKSASVMVIRDNFMRSG